MNRNYQLLIAILISSVVNCTLSFIILSWGILAKMLIYILLSMMITQVVFKYYDNKEIIKEDEE